MDWELTMSTYAWLMSGCALAFAMFSAFLFIRERYPQRLRHRFTRKRERALLTRQFREYRDQRMGLFASLTVEGKNALVGDSLFDGSEWDELMPGQAAVNRGIGGAETATILEGLDLFLRQKPRSITLMVGINDLRHYVPLDEVKENYRKIVARIAARSIPLVVNSVTPVGKGHDDAAMINEWVKELNDYLIELARTHDFEFVDLHPALSEEGFLKSSCTNDNLHLTQDGYLAWKEVLLPRLAALSPARETRRRSGPSFGLVR